MRVIYISEEAVREFNNTWPGSNIEVREYRVEFSDSTGDLIDHDFDEDSLAVVALIEEAVDRHG